MKPQQTLLVLSIALLTFNACNKRSGTNTTDQIPYPKEDTCKPIIFKMATDFDLSDQSPWTSTLSYTGSLINNITVSPGPSSRQYIYSGNYPVRINRTNMPSNTFDSVFYDASKNITAKKFYYNGVLSDMVGYQYTNNKRTNVIWTQYGSSPSTSSKTYQYNNGLLSKVERYDASNVLYDSYSYTYSTIANKLYTENPLIDLYLHIDEDMESVIYDGLLNNPTLIEKIVYTDVGGGNVTFAITYDLNAQGYPTKVKSNGKILLEVQYQCD